MMSGFGARLRHLCCVLVTALCCLPGCGKQAQKNVAKAVVRAVLPRSMRSGFFVEKGVPVYRHWNEGDGQHVEQLPGADAATFKVIEQAMPARAYYARDSHLVFMARNHRAVRILEAHAASFALLTPEGSFSHDADHVFFYDMVIEGADPKSFRRVSGDFSKDSTRAYIGAISIPVEDLATWEPLQPGRFDGISYRKFRDEHPQAEMPSILATGWSRDSQAAYYGNRVYSDADIQTLQVLTGAYAKHKNHVYNFDKIIEGADAATFTAADGPYLGDTSIVIGSGPDARDANHEYRYGKPR
jgi:hypothetical protein